MFDMSGNFALGEEFSAAESSWHPRHALCSHGRPGKRLFDLCMCLLLLPLMMVVMGALLLLNPFFNKGPLFFVQKRMGKDMQPFPAFKFRTMTAAPRIARGAFDALESNRITPLGAVLRKTRLDEIPQILNVLRGEMSLIGPRPDFYDHAVIYASQVRGYRERHTIVPGISGLAQVRVGYVDGLAGVRRKVAADLLYAERASWKLDLWVTWQTIRTVVARQGS
ncbi:lipopolysaccharide/colanic/teichoic acid biosynthesis glycosyltransferase [Limimaricola soesokkakensis]|uniref:Lipopolysaccharide/colanic/teichoic acid biosynthesis glycosyltransferase n=1 Tax=Limimaricola soesokkakensis TaxID=1343159 RepID=A0A1X7A038_9RHOB|nr:sugar transferase [Limimaricola soesokkakensis]PSK80404.1 lipopolysaccharide/colanic/teichoic acid biosynthesis glycosyltransferase [Limimaricola soesokkakensis]SLN66821.1 UDP-N-acetylgalactosamine-undecaprenyl-phosphate N-acetylgalactosaminephosphotransferase [Limimaricola soesokkakensis]